MMGNKHISLFSVIALFFLMCSCTKTFSSQEELNDYVRDDANGYRYNKEVNGVQYILQYRPTDLLVNQELDEQYDKIIADSLRDKYHKYIYFNLSISKNNQEILNSLARDRNAFGKMVSELAFNMDENIYFYSPRRDTIEMVDFVYPRMYGMTNNTSVMIVYPRSEEVIKEKYFTIEIKDFGLSTGNIKFKVDMDPIKNEPKLELLKYSDYERK